MWADVLAWTNVGVTFCIACLQIYDFIVMKGRKYRWVKLAIGIVALYWCALYIFVGITVPGNYDSVAFGQIFVRPANTLTFFVMLAGALYRHRTGKIKWTTP